jgi:hypothetical protein
VEGGGTFFHVIIKNDSPYVEPQVHRNGLGGWVGVGAMWNVYRCLFLNLFTDYSFRRGAPSSDPGGIETGLNVGGFDFGAGLSYKF